MNRSWLTLALPLLLTACGNGTPTPGTPDTQKPVVTLSAPEQAALNSSVKVVAEATDNVGVKAVRFYVGEELVATDTTAPYELPLDLKQSGLLTLRAVAVDTSGNENEPATRTVRVGEGDFEAPMLVFSGPKSVQTTAPVEFTVSATDDRGVARVEFYEGGTKLATVTQAPYVLTRSFTLADRGQHTYRAVAYDAAGNKAESTYTFTVALSDNMDLERPTLTLDVPLQAITVPGEYKLGFSASDNVGVVRLDVQLIAQTAFGSDVKSFTLTQSSGQLPLPVTRELNGTYTLTVTAYDASGNSARQMAIFKVMIP